LRWPQFSCHFAAIPSRAGQASAAGLPGLAASEFIRQDRYVMRVTLERSNLLKALNHVHRVVERRNTIPILSNVLLKAEGASLALKATDLDLEVTEATAAEVHQAGATTVPAHLLYDIVRKLPEGAEVMLRTGEDGNAMAIVSGRANFRLQCLPQSDFPELSAGAFSHIFRIESSALKNLIDKTQFAISTEETRYYLNGIYLHFVEGGKAPKLRAVATDGHRLARSEFDAPAGAEGMPGVIVPRKTVSELHKLVDDPDVKVTVELSDTKIRFTIGSIVLTSKLIDGTFPDYQRVIPTANERSLTIDRQSFAQAVDRVSTISTERGRAVKLSLSEGQLVLTVNNPDSGSATEELAADYRDDPMEIGFNARYLLDVTAQLSGDQAHFLLADAGSPTLIRDTADKDSLYVLMPMRV
jgi:DNA polymerase-3 subunit beta